MLLQTLAWAVKVDDAASARMTSNSEMRDFIVDASREFVFMSSALNALDWRFDPPSGCTIASVADPHNGPRVNRGELVVNCATSEQRDSFACKRSHSPPSEE
jgi:hypothetical protein